MDATGEPGRSARWDAISAHRSRLLRIARSRTATRADAEDCVHDAMLRAAEFPDLDEERLGQFLTSVTTRLCADRYRSERSAERACRRLAGRRADLEPTAEEIACDRAEAAWVAGLIPDLPATQQDVVRARAAGQSSAEIAHRLRMSRDAVDSQLYRIRRVVYTAITATFGVAALTAGVANAPTSGEQAPDVLSVVPPPRSAAVREVRQVPPPVATRATRRPAVSAMRIATEPRRTHRAQLLAGSAGAVMGQVHTGRTTVEEVLRCMDEHWVVSPTYIGCTP